MAEVNLKSKLPTKFFTKIINNRNDNCREGHRAEAAKNFKYSQTASNNNSKFLGFVMETNGYINDKWVLFEYESKLSKLTYELNDADLLEGKNNLKLIVTDNVGNSTIFESQFFRSIKK